MTSYNTITIAYLLGIIGLLQLTGEGAASLLIVTVGALALGVHLLLHRQHRAAARWGRLCTPFFIIDRGPFRVGSLNLPDHLEGQYLLSPPQKVRKLEAKVRAYLVQAENFWYNRDDEYRLPITVIYFREAKHCNEDGEAYKSRIVETMEKARLSYHVKLLEGERGPSPKIKPGGYEETFLRSGLNNPN